MSVRDGQISPLDVDSARSLACMCVFVASLTFLLFLFRREKCIVSDLCVAKRKQYKKHKNSITKMMMMMMMMMMWDCSMHNRSYIDNKSKYIHTHSHTHATTTTKIATTQLAIILASCVVRRQATRSTLANNNERNHKTKASQQHQKKPS